MAKTWAIIGGGNGGQTIAGHLSILGEEVRLFDVVPETVEAINEKGAITLHHAVEGVGKIQFATTDMEKAVTGADVVMMVLPSTPSARCTALMFSVIYFSPLYKSR